MHRDAVFGDAWVVFGHRIKYDNRNDQKGWNYIRVVPEVRVVLLEPVAESAIIVFAFQFMELFILLYKEVSRAYDE